MHGTRILEEADRLMTVCNSCRYCEGLCAVFPAMEMRRAFSDGDLNYLANLCHGCGACYTDCQFSPPHEFNVNVPKTLAINPTRPTLGPVSSPARSHATASSSA
jgi:citrate/tricarballylate utilization protein